MPCLKFFQVAETKEGKDAAGLKSSIKQAFIDNKLQSVLNKIVFLGSVGASVNSGKKSSLIRLFQEDYEWVCFIW